MRKRIKPSFAFMFLVLGMLLGTAFCTREIFKGEWKPPSVVTIKGVKKRILLPMMSWNAYPNEKTGLGILAREGDVLAIEVGSMGTAFPYLKGDGRVLSFTYDDYGLLLEGRRVFVDLGRQSTATYLANKASDDEIAHIRMCRMGSPVPETGTPRFSAIQRLSKINPNSGWWVENPEVLRYVLRLFNPRWLIMEGGSPLEEEEFRLISSEPALEYLSIPLKSGKIKYLRCPEKLGTLIITDWESDKTGPFTGDWSSLKSLRVFGFSMKDLSPITPLKGVDELHLLLGKNLTDIRALGSFSDLKALNLAGCDHIDDLSVLKELKKLQWLGLPPGTPQKEFEGILRNHPDLKILELVKCKRIKDLSPLRDLEKLESLVVLGKAKNLDPLRAIKGLRFLALPKDAFEEASEMEKLKKALPECRIVKAEPFCLGSGWILLLLPAVALAWFLSNRGLEKRYRAVKGNG